MGPSLLSLGVALAPISILSLVVEVEMMVVLERRQVMSRLPKPLVL